MRIELFGIARRRAGCEAVDVDADHLGGALRALADACPSLVPDVVADGQLTANFIASLNGDAFVTDLEMRLSPGDTLLVLGAQAGG